jgi:hypothetical protein
MKDDKEWELVNASDEDRMRSELIKEAQEDVDWFEKKLARAKMKLKSLEQ